MASLVSHSPAHHPSPSHSPALRPIGGTASLPTLSPIAAYTPRSYARIPTQRPYLLCNNRSSSSKPTRPVIGDTKAFADKVAFMVEKRASQVRVPEPMPVGTSPNQRSGRSLGGAGSFSSTSELERAELIVDYPVWSPGSFQDLSTLQALRETTMAHTHALIQYLSVTHNIPASYRLLTRSATNNNARCSHSGGWGCIRLTPTVTSPVQHRAELRPAVRRTSTVGSPPIAIRHRTSSSSHTKSGKKSTSSSPLDDIPQFRLDFEDAIADDESEIEVELKSGFGSSAGSDDECEDECADVLIAKEVEKRNLKEGSAFVMTLFGAPALILC